MAYRRHDYFLKPSDLQSDDDLLRGDIIQIKRSLKDTRWAVYIGDEEFITLAEKLNDSPGREEECIIDKLNISGIATVFDVCRVNNYLDKYLKCYTAEEIVAKADKFCGSVWKFDSISNNSEHFVTYCRYGIAMSLESGTVNFASMNCTSLSSFDDLRWFTHAQAASRQESLSAFGMSRPSTQHDVQCRCL